MDFLPVVKMDYVPDEVVEADTDNVSDEEVEEVEAMPMPVEDDTDEEDIFEPQTPAVRVKAVADVKLTKKGVPRKKRAPMTEDHKVKLQAARVKAVAARKQKAIDNKASKELEKEEKELLKKQKVKRVQKLKEEVEQEETFIKEPIKFKSSFTKEDLEDAQLQAIMSYEKIRKERKKVKETDRKINYEKEVLQETIRRVVQPKDTNPYQNCY
tara:strand:- start:2585 stop:3220 length:636 start_codon:yes stop_codon:yes gene_type:complete